MEDFGIFFVNKLDILPFFFEKMLSLFTSFLDGQSHPLVGQTLKIGSRSVVVRSLLAEGGYALVFTVQDTQNSQWYALKRQLAADPQAAEAIVREIKFLKKVFKKYFSILANCK